ncbi:MAG: hypothetical protein J5532_09135 [Lachnospiraceae bacterium]|nr:hypothetical protein [Lachnospiraceae bacterium]
MKAGRVYKVYPDKLTEQCCKGVFFGAIAQALITLGLLVTTIVTKQFGKLHPMMHLFAFACMLVAAGLFAAAAYVGMRREFHMLFFYASVAMAFGAILLSVDAGIAFSSMTDGHTLSLVGQIIIVAAMLLSILTLIVGDDAKKQFYKLSDDRLMIGGVGILMALAGLVAVFCALFDKGGSPMKIWEALFFFVILVLVSAMPVVLLFGCSRLTDPVTDREIEEGTIVPGGSNLGAGNKNAKKDDKKDDKKDGGRDRKNDKNASKNDGRPGKGNADKKSDKKPDKSVKAEEASKKDGKDEKSGKQETPSEDKKDKKDGAKGFGFLKGKDKDKNKGKKDKDSKKDSGSEREESGDVIATTKHKPVKSTNPTDLDAFLREAEEADERKVRDAVWEAAREKEREVEKEKEKAEEAAFSEKNSKKKDKKSKKDRKKEKEKVYSGVNTALFTNPNKPKEKRYIPTVNVGLNHADAAEETAEEEIRIESASIFDEPAQKAVETAAETAETVTEAAENVAEDVFGSLEETNVVAEAAEEVASAVADEAAELEGAAAGETEELAEEAEAEVEAAEEAAENAAGAFDSSTVAEAAEDAEQILRNHEEAMRKLREEINLRLGERYQAEKTNDIEEYLGDSSEDDVTRAAEEAAFAAIDAAEESIDDAAAAEEAVEDAFGEAAESAEDAFGETAEAVEDTFGEAVENAEDAFGETAEAAEDTFGETAEAAEDTFGEAVENAEDAFGETAEAAEDTFGEVAEAVEDTLGEAVENAEDAFGETAEAAEDTFGEAAEAVEDTFGEAVESAEDAFGETAEAAEDTFGAVEEAAEDAFGAAKETFSAAEDAFDSVGTIGGFAEDTSDDSAGDLFRAAANKPRAVASSFAEAMEEAAGEDLFAASPVFRSAEEAPKYEEETTEEDTFGAVEFTEAVREPAKRRWFMEDDYDKKPTASLEADDLFAPVGTKPVSASVPEFTPAEEFASAKPAEAVAAESAETEEEEPVVEVPSQNQAILWALQHGGSFETAKEEAAADAEPAEADVADAGAAEEEPSSFAEAMAEAMGRPTVAPSFAGSASVGAVATETAEEKESGEEEPEVVVPNANQAILWAMMHGGSIEAAKQAVAEQAAARAAEATKAAEAVQAEAVTLIDEADEIPEEVLAGNYYDEAGEDIADAATEAYETVSESVDEAEDFASTLAQAREKWAHLNGEGVSDDEFEDSPAEPEFPEAPAYDEPLYETAEEFGETDSAPAEETVEPMYAEAPAELTEEPASTAEQEVEAEEASVTETAEYEAEETSETETDEYDGEASEEEESEPEGPIVPEYLQQQAISVEERARRAAAKAAAAKSAPKPVKQADTSIDDFTKKLKQLKVAYENDLITEEEYNEAKKHLLELL